MPIRRINFTHSWCFRLLESIKCSSRQCNAMSCAPIVGHTDHAGLCRGRRRLTRSGNTGRTTLASPRHHHQLGPGPLPGVALRSICTDHVICLLCRRGSHRARPLCASHPYITLQCTLVIKLVVTTITDMHIRSQNTFMTNAGSTANMYVA